MPPGSAQLAETTEWILVGGEKWNVGSLKGTGHQPVGLCITTESEIRLNVLDTHKLYLWQKNWNLMGSGQYILENSELRLHYFIGS